VYKVLIKKKVLKNIDKMAKSAQEKLNLLIKDLHNKGFFRTEWPNYSKLDDNLYHCHLSYKWIACWKYENNKLEIEVYYAGSRENGPY